MIFWKNTVHHWQCWQRLKLAGVSMSLLKKITSKKRVAETLRLLRKGVIAKAVFEADGYFQDVSFCFGSFCFHAGPDDMDGREKVLANDIKIFDGVEIVFDYERWKNGSHLSWGVELSFGWANTLELGCKGSIRADSREDTINALLAYLKEGKKHIKPRFQKDRKKLIEALNRFGDSYWYFKI
jgi:hypothetical protein